MNYLADIRDGRYRFITDRSETHEWVGRRMYQYVCAVYECKGFYVEEARVAAEAAMRTAYKRKGEAVAVSASPRTLTYIGCNHREVCADCDDCTGVSPGSSA